MYFKNIETLSQDPNIIRRAEKDGQDPYDVALEDEMNRLKSEIGNRLRTFRKSKHWKQEEMIRHCPYHEMSNSAYSKWENGGNFPDISFLVYIHEEYHIDLNWLIAGDSSKPKMPPEIMQAFDNFKKVFETFQKGN